MINKLYGIDYDVYATGGSFNLVIFKSHSETELFDNEAEFMKRALSIKNDYRLSIVNMYEFEIDKSKSYKFTY